MSNVINKTNFHAILLNPFIFLFKAITQKTAALWKDACCDDLAVCCGGTSLDLDGLATRDEAEGSSSEVPYTCKANLRYASWEEMEGNMYRDRWR